jgi:hypothetical protein
MPSLKQLTDENFTEILKQLTDENFTEIGSKGYIDSEKETQNMRHRLLKVDQVILRYSDKDIEGL